MVDRTSRLRLVVDSSDAGRAERQLDSLARSADNAGDQADRLQRRTQGLNQGFATLGRSVGGLAASFAGLAAAAGGAFITVQTIRTAADFERQMSAVLAVTGATAEQFAALNAEARRLGSETAFTASQAADGLEFLARAGFTAEQAIAAVGDTLNLAAAGQLELGRAADIASNVLTSFGISADNTAIVTDTLAAAAASANTNVDQLGQAIKFVGPVAANLGVSLQDTTAAISALSDAGLQAELAGTGLRRVLIGLSDGTFDDILGDSFDLSAPEALETALLKIAEAGITAEEAIDRVGFRGGPALTVLADAAEKVAEQSDLLNDAAGSAERIAEIQLDNVAGDFLLLQSAVEELQLTAADAGLNQSIRELTQAVTEGLRSDSARELAEVFGGALSDAISGATEGLRAFVETSQGIVGVYEDVLAQLEPVLGRIEDFIGQAFDTDPIQNAIDALLNALNPLRGAGELIGSINLRDRGRERIADNTRLFGSDPLSASAFDDASEIIRALEGSTIAQESAALAQIDAAEAQQAAATVSREASRQEAQQLDAIRREAREDFAGSLPQVDLRSIFRNVTGVDQVLNQRDDRLAELELALIGGSIDRATFDAEALGIREASAEAITDFSEAIISAGERFKQEIGFAAGSFIDALIFGQPSDIGFLGQSLLRDQISSLFTDPISDFFSGNGGLGQNINDAVGSLGVQLGSTFSQVGKQFSDELGETFRQIGTGLGQGLGLAGASFGAFQAGQGLAQLGGFAGNPSSALAGGAIGGIAGAIGLALVPALGPLGPVLGALAGGLLGNAFSNPSNNAAGGRLNFDTFETEGAFSQGRGGNEPARDALLASTEEFVRTLERLTGADARGGVIVDVGNRDGIQISRGGETTQFGINETEEALEFLFGIVVESLRGGERAFRVYAQAAQDAGDAPEAILETLASLDALAQLTADDPLSPIQQALLNIDETLAPVIDTLDGFNAALREIAELGDEARRAVGEDFLEEVSDLNLRLRNSTLADYQAILEEIEQRSADARALFEAGAITAGELELVNATNALQAQRFFEGLSDEELQDLGSFFDLLEDVGGEVTVVLAQLEQGIRDFVDNADESREALQQTIDETQGFADAIRRSADGIRQAFPSESGTDLLDSLRQQLLDLREGALAGDQAAFEQLPGVANQFVELSRSLFGSTAQFASERDFALGILDQTGNLAQSRADAARTELEALNEQSAALAEIRDALDSPDDSIPLLEEILEEGRIQNETLTELLQQYILLAQEQTAAGTITPGQAEDAANDFFGSGASTTTGNGNSGFDEVSDAVTTTGSQQVILLNQMVAQNQLIIEELGRITSVNAA